MKWNNKGHQFDYIGLNYKKKNKIFIYGAGEAGSRLMTQLKQMNLAFIVDGFIDKDIEKQKSGFMGVKVYSPDILFNKLEKEHFIVPTFNLKENTDRVVDRLLRAGYIENIDFISVQKFQLNLNDIFLPVYAMYAHNKLIISSTCCIPSNKCNLNCRDCLNFTPHLNHFFERELNEVCEDIDLLFKWIDYTNRFQISGGEPLLYKNFNELARYIGERYRNKINIYETVLNGTIVPSEETCAVMKEHNMTVYLDNYVSNISERLNKREEIIEILEKHNILWIDNTVEKWFSLDVFNTDNTYMGEEGLREMFDFCNNPWHCYEDGKMYACNFAKFAIEAGLNKENQGEYFDFNDMSQDKRMELLEFTLNYNQKGYVDFCKRCAGWDSINQKPVPVAIQSKRQV